MNRTQKELNRLYYKNNLYEFCRNEIIINKINDIVCSVTGFVDNNNPPKHIEDKLLDLWNIISEYVFYNHQIPDRVYRLKHSKRKAVVVIDTDS